jgi:hypothetical protein
MGERAGLASLRASRISVSSMPYWSKSPWAPPSLLVRPRQCGPSGQPMPTRSVMPPPPSFWGTNRTLVRQGQFVPVMFRKQGGRQAERRVIPRSARSQSRLSVIALGGVSADDRRQMRSDSPAAAQEVLAGLVERVTFHNEENGFCVLRIRPAFRGASASTPFGTSKSCAR